LILKPIDPLRPAAGLQVVDLGPHKARQDAQDEANVARAERDAFVADCQSLLEEPPRAKPSMRSDAPSRARIPFRSRTRWSQSVRGREVIK